MGVSAVCGWTYCDAIRLDDEASRFRESLRDLRPRYEELDARWDYRNISSRLSTIIWPENIDDEQDVPILKRDLNACKIKSGKGWVKACGDIQFRLAMALLCLQHKDEAVSEGTGLMNELADEGHGDGQCGFGICLNDRSGTDDNSHRAIGYWQKAVEQHDHLHALYELGVSYYTDESIDDSKAADLFKRAALRGHQSAMFMYADCLFHGVGVDMDRAKGLYWYMQSGEKGHRSARAAVLALLEQEMQKEVENNR